MRRPDKSPGRVPEPGRSRPPADLLRSGPEPPRRPRRARPLALDIGVAVALTAVGVTGGIMLTRGGDDPVPPKPGAPGKQEVRSAFAAFPADAAAKGDGLDQELTAVAAEGTVAVAAGGESDPQGGGSARTLFVVSPDGGHTWKQAPV